MGDMITPNPDEQSLHPAEQKEIDGITKRGKSALTKFVVSNKIKALLIAHIDNAALIVVVFSSVCLCIIVPKIYIIVPVIAVYVVMFLKFWYGRSRLPARIVGILATLAAAAIVPSVADFSYGKQPVSEVGQNQTLGTSDSLGTESTNEQQGNSWENFQFSFGLNGNQIHWPASIFASICVIGIIIIANKALSSKDFFMTQ